MRGTRGLADPRVATMRNQSRAQHAEEFRAREAARLAETTIKGISIRAPWWWFILHAGKDIENRGWSTDHRGPIAIHASKWWDYDEVDGDQAEARNMMAGYGLDPKDHLVAKAWLWEQRGMIVGTAELVDCVEAHASPWFVGRYGFVLANPRPLVKPAPFKGRLGLFDVPKSMVGL